MQFFVAFTLAGIGLVLLWAGVNGGAQNLWGETFGGGEPLHLSDTTSGHGSIGPGLRPQRQPPPPLPHEPLRKHGRIPLPGPHPIPVPR